MKGLFIAILALTLTGCLTEKKRQQICQSCPVVIKDSIREVIKVTPFDTTLFISQMGKDLMFDFSSDCCQLMDSITAQMARGNGTITVEEKGVKSQIFKKNNKIVFRCLDDSLREVIKGLRTLVEKSEVKIDTKFLPAPPCTKPHKDWLDKYDRPGFFILLFLLLLRSGWKYGPTLLTVFRKLRP